jgi:three-Cys-motif partner protein
MCPAISIFGHMSPSDNDWVTSEHDGLRARKSGLWARDKLSFLDDFVPPALQATGCTPRPKRQRWYVDLFAGPGRNVHVKSGTEFEGSAIRVLPMSAQRNPAVHFTHAAIVNKDRDDQAALVERIRRLREKGLVPIPERNMEILTHDANRVIARILEKIDKRAYAFVFVDITAPRQWPWSSVKKLKAEGHQSIDLYLLFPLGMALKRLLSHNERTVQESTPVLDAFFGADSGWRSLLDLRKSDALAKELGPATLRFYMERLQREGWKYVIDARDIKRENGAPMYHMLYATNHLAGDNIGAWSAGRKPAKPQTEMF